MSIEQLEQKFHSACAEGDIDLVASLLQQGVNANAFDRYGATALNIACYNGKLELAQLLVRHGADPSAPNRHGIVSLDLACINGHLEVARFLLEQGVDPNITDPDGGIPLHFLCKSGTSEDIPLIMLLIQYGADLTKMNNRGETPDQLAQRSLNKAVHTFLTENDIQDVAAAGETPDSGDDI